MDEVFGYRRFRTRVVSVALLAGLFVGPLAFVTSGGLA